MSSAELIDPRDDEILVNGARSLAELEAFARRDLDILDYPVKPWLKPMKTAGGAHVYDVIVLGAGHTGI